MIGTGSSEKDNRMFKICPKFVLYVLPGTLAIVHDRETMAPVAWVQRFRFEIQTEMDTGPGQGAELAWRRNTDGRLPGIEAG